MCFTVHWMMVHQKRSTLFRIYQFNTHRIIDNCLCVCVFVVVVFVAHLPCYSRTKRPTRFHVVGLYFFCHAATAFFLCPVFFSRTINRAYICFELKMFVFVNVYLTLVSNQTFPLVKRWIEQVEWPTNHWPKCKICQTIKWNVLIVMLICTSSFITKEIINFTVFFSFLFTHWIRYYKIHISTE